MAKKRIINRGYKPIKNSHLIGRGGKHIKPVRGSWVKGYNKAIGKTQIKTKPIKKSLKSKGGYVAKKSASFSKKINRTKTTPVRIKGLNKMKAKISRTPSPTMKMKSRTPVRRKPPNKGRGR